MKEDTGLESMIQEIVRQEIDGALARIHERISVVLQPPVEDVNHDPVWKKWKVYREVADLLHHPTQPNGHQWNIKSRLFYIGRVLWTMAAQNFSVDDAWDLAYDLLGRDQAILHDGEVKNKIHEYFKMD